MPSRQHLSSKCAARPPPAFPAARRIVRHVALGVLVGRHGRRDTVNSPFMAGVREEVLKGLSRMMGNYQVRFLPGAEPGPGSAYSANAPAAHASHYGVTQSWRSTTNN